jgi:hypothetical protein
MTAYKKKSSIEGFWRRKRDYLHDHFSSKNGTKTLKALKKGFKLTVLTNKKASYFCLLASFVQPLFWSSGGERGSVTSLYNPITTRVSKFIVYRVPNRVTELEYFKVLCFFKFRTF